MSVFFPRVAFGPMRCAPVARHEFAPLLSLFDDSLNELARASRQSRKTFHPRFDVKETKDSYSVEGELPGVVPKDLSIEFVDEHTLTIKGKTERYSETGTRPSEQVPETQQPASEETATTSETGSVKSHQATVEDEEPANSSAVKESTTTQEVAAPAAAQETVKGDKPQYWISERSVGSFSRSFSFPARVDQDAVKASLKDGILSIVVPKAPAPENRRINIE